MTDAEMVERVAREVLNLDMVNRKAQAARRNLELANARLGNAKGLKEV